MKTAKVTGWGGGGEQVSGFCRPAPLPRPFSDHTSFESQRCGPSTIFTPGLPLVLFSLLLCSLFL